MKKDLLRSVRVASLILFAGTGHASQALELTAHPLRFDDVEARFADDGQLSEAQAVAQAAIPIGSTAALAQATLENAGARCTPQWHEPQNVLCVYRQRAVVDDYYQADIVWTATLHIQTSRVVGLTLDRELDKH